MRSLLGGWSPAIVSVLVAFQILGCPRVAAAQSSSTGAMTKSADAAAMRPVVRTASSGEVALERRTSARLESAQRLLFDGRYADATTAFASVLDRPDASRTDSLTIWAHHGAAVSEALAGHLASARSHYDAVLRAPTTPAFALADSIEAAVLTGRSTLAAQLLDRFADSYRSVLAQQYAHSFRALNFALAGNCGAAFEELNRAPDITRPLPQAIDGFCEARAGHHAKAAALRDSVMTHPLADPYSWPMIVARGVALKVH